MGKESKRRLDRARTARARGPDPILLLGFVGVLVATFLAAAYFGGAGAFRAPEVTLPGARNASAP